MINFETLNLKKEKDIATIALARPHAINAINIQMRDDLYEALTAVKEDPEIRALIFYGEGTKGFCSGADINDFGKGREDELANLLYKEAIVSDDILLKVKRRGVSVDPEKLPKLDNVSLPA